MSGLRERKRAATREAIQRHGLCLIGELGYDATTCEQIAAAAQVSPATFFRYFPTKEDVVLRDVFDPVIAMAVRGRPAGESPLTAVRRALAPVLEAFPAEEMESVRQRTALILSVPALRARFREQQAELVRHLSAAFSERGEGRVTDLEVQVAAWVCAAALAVAVERWAEEGDDLATQIDQALRAVAALAKRATR